jgi:hypothetical protein
VGDIPTDGVIRLEPQATEIEGFTVEARELCPIDDDDQARRLWSEVASRYSTETESRAWFAYLSRYGGSVREQDLHRTPDSGFVNQIAAGGPGIIHGGDHTHRSDRRVRMASSGGRRYHQEPRPGVGIPRARQDPCTPLCEPCVRRPPRLRSGQRIGGTDHAGLLWERRRKRSDDQWHDQLDSRRSLSGC